MAGLEVTNANWSMDYFVHREKSFHPEGDQTLDHVSQSGCGSPCVEILKTLHDKDLSNLTRLDGFK